MDTNRVIIYFYRFFVVIILFFYPVEESRLFKKIYEYSREKTAIIVTHRMALAKLADRVLVMKNGKIVQDGTHEQLMYFLEIPCRVAISSNGV